jgi:hypothetical protein
MNPDRHATSHYDYFKDLIKGDDASAEAHRKFYDEYNAVLDMDADYYLETIKTVFQDYKLVHGTWDVRSPEGKIERVRPQDITTTALFTVEGELDDISGSGQTEAAHDLCTGIVSKEQRHLEAKGAGPLRHLQWPPLARTGVPAGEGLHSPTNPKASCGPACSVRQRLKARHVHRRGRLPSCHRQATLRALAARINAALPQTQCTRCGYPDCAAYAQAVASGEAAINQCPPGGPQGIARLAPSQASPLSR